MSEAKSGIGGYKLYGLPLPYFLVIALVVIVAAVLGVLPTGMAGAFLLMITLGTVLQEIGDKTPIVNTYLGGGAIVIIFGTGLLQYFGVFPEAVVTSVDASSSPQAPSSISTSRR